MAFRLDIGTLGSAERTPQGGLKVPAFLTRSGVFEYHADDGRVIREYRPPEEVFKADALRTLPDAPVTNDHPPEHVYPENFKRFSVGHVAGEAKQDGEKVAASMIIQDADAIRAINNGRREVSCGYHCDVDETPGTAPSGERYDRIQRNIRYNHVAIVDDGRAGSQVRLRLDGSGNCIPPTREYRMDSVPAKEYERIDGVKYEVGSDPHKAAVERRDAAEKKAQEDQAALVARADAATAKLADAEKRLTDLQSPERFDKAVAIRGAIIGHAQKILGKEFKADGLSNFDIKSAVAQKAFPGLRADSKYKDAAQQRAYVNALFRAAISAAPATTRADSKVAPVPPPHLLTPPPSELRGDGGGQPVTMESIRQRRNDEMEARHRKPLMASKEGKPTTPSNGFPSLQSSMLETMK